MVEQSESDYKKELEAAGVDVPQEETIPEVETPQEPKVEEPEEPEKQPDEPIVERKRSIYDDLKEKKHELRSERETREQLERENAELRAKLESNISEEPSDIARYAEEKGADPELVQRIIEEARQGLKPEIPDELKKGIEEFQSWKTQNAHIVEKQLFDSEFERTMPSLKEMFPNASNEDLVAMKSQLDILSHSKEMFDKPLDYVAFKHRQTLETLVSPKKRGMESRGKIDAPESSNEFNLSEDFAKMTPAQREAWEKNYNELVNSDKSGMAVQGNRKTIL